MTKKASRKSKKLVFVLGIRPDIIRAALIMNYLAKARDVQTVFIWSGQHYSDNLKGIFFRELGMREPDYNLGCSGDTDAEIAAQLIDKLYPVLTDLKPTAVVFLGDTNTTLGCIAAAQLNIPIIHIEGCWRSYDWRMPEEKCRSLIDHLADVIYTYEDEYKQQGIAEGLNPENIVVVGNPIVDILNKFYFSKQTKFKKIASKKFFQDRNIKKKQYLLMTCHRRENVHVPRSFKAIMNLIDQAPYPVYFPASYRTQKVMNQMKLKRPKNLIVTDPIGYEEILTLMVNSVGVITDSGTIVEETCILNIPTVQMRKSTERPQVYDAGGCIKFDPDQADKYPAKIIYQKLNRIMGKEWQHKLGDGKSSQRIAKDMIKRVKNNQLRGHLSENSHLPVARNYREDGIKI